MSANWKSMESAPKDGSVVLLRISEFGKREFPAYFNAGKSAWYAKGLPKGTQFPIHPTQWQQS